MLLINKYIFFFIKKKGYLPLHILPTSYLLLRYFLLATLKTWLYNLAMYGCIEIKYSDNI